MSPKIQSARREWYGRGIPCLRVIYCYLITLILVTRVHPGTAPFPTPGEWPGFRRNGSLDARSPLSGHMLSPRVRWKHFVGSKETLLAISTADAPPPLDPTAALPSGIEAQVDDARWGLSSPLSMIGGRLQPRTPTRQVTYADIFPEDAGLERIEFETGFAKPTVNGQWQPSIGRCAAWRNNAWEIVWESVPIDLLFQALPIIGDFDGDDANTEIAVVPWYELLLLDAATGTIKDRCRFTDGRSYGFFGVYDFNADNSSEFLVMADFSKHIDVLGFREGKLTLLWQRNIELDIANPATILRVLPDPAADIIGNGMADIVANVYNEAGDGRWHALVLDGMTGITRFDLEDEFVHDTVDVDGDGVHEIFTTHTSGAGLPQAGMIAVRSLKNDRMTVRWHDPRARWALWEPPLPLHVNSTATRGRERVLQTTAHGRVVAGIFRPIGDDDGHATDSIFQAISWGEAGFRQDAAVAGSRLKALGIDADGTILLATVTAPGAQAEVTQTAGHMVHLGSRMTTVSPGPAVVARNENQTIIVVQGDAEEVVAFEAPESTTPIKERWRRPGRGQGVDWPNTHGCVIGQLNQGTRAAILATAAPTGCARITAMTLDETTLWNHDFNEIPGTAPTWNTGGIILWQTGFFTDPDHQDVLVTVRRSMMHSEETVLLDGRDGHIIWHRDRQISNRGVGGTHFALADMDGDGLDDAVSLHPSILYLLKGTSGHDLLARDATWDAVPSKPVYWGLPMTGDFSGQGKTDILFASERRSMTGLIRGDGSLVWWDALDHSTTCYPAVGDVDGDGELEIVGFGYDDGIRCYDAATGTIEWRMPLPIDGVPAGTATADVESDGRDNVLLTSGNTLVCLAANREGTSAQVTWRLDFPGRLAPPVIADLEGNGQASILITDSTGWVHAVR